MSTASQEVQLPDRVRLSISVDKEHWVRLREIAAGQGMPVAVLMRAFIEHGLGHLDTDPQVAGAVERIGAVERERRRQASALGGRRGARTRAAQIDQQLAAGQYEPAAVQDGDQR